MTLPDQADLDSYGGPKVNEAPVEDPTTDLDADHLNDAFNDVAMMTRTAPRAWRRFLGHASTPGDPAAHIHGAQWGSRLQDKPVVARTAEGVYTLTWPETVTDELGREKTVNLVYAKAWVEITGSTAYDAYARVTGANVVEVRVFTKAGVLDDAAGFTIVVEAR